MSKTASPSVVQNIVFAVKYAQKHGTWVVVVSPGEGEMAVCRQVLSAAIPEGAVFSGRTALLGEGKVSVVTVRSDVFVPEDEPYEVLFVGWSDDAQRDDEMAKWYSDTSQVLREHPL
jgi:hypothetical protein